MSTSPILVVVADDRTGANETAGACAELGCGNVPVMPWSTTRAMSNMADAVIVVDLQSRHVDPATAAARVDSVARRAGEGVDGGARIVHKIDSTLRGNWASEIVASQRRNRAPVIVVPAFPMAGRTCVNGVVFDHGVAVADGPAGRDPRQPVTSSEPSVHLTMVGADNVVCVQSAEGLRAWAGGRSPGIAVCDASDDADIALLAAVWSEHPTAIYAGTAASVAAAACAFVGPRRTRIETTPVLPLEAPVLIVCGSLHPAARRQLKMLAERTAGLVGASLIDTLATPVPATPAPISFDAALRQATLLAGEARDAMARRQYATVIVVGGDTAAALLGNEPSIVNGILAPGTAWGHHNGAVIVTRPGGFGGDAAIADLVVAHDGTVRATASGQ